MTNDIEIKESNCQNDKNKLSLFVCNKCNSKIISDKNYICMNCMNPKLEKKEFNDNLNSDYIIPFKYNKKEAINIYNNLKEGNLLIPFSFKSKKNIKDICGVYVPFLAFDYNISGNTEAKCKKISKFKSGNYNYTKTDSYQVNVEGNMKLKKVLVSNSKLVTNDDLSKLLPYHYNELKDFSYDIIDNYSIESILNEKEKLTTVSDFVATTNYINAIKDNLSEYNDINQIKDDLKLDVNSIKTIYLPFWILNIKYRKKIYRFLINGQTGKVSGNMIVNKLAIIYILIALLIISFLITYFIYVWVAK